MAGDAVEEDGWHRSAGLDRFQRRLVEAGDPFGFPTSGYSAFFGRMFRDIPDVAYESETGRSIWTNLESRHAYDRERGECEREHSVEPSRALGGDPFNPVAAQTEAIIGCLTSVLFHV